MTASPYAAASRLELRNVAISTITPTKRIQFITGT